MYRDKIHWSQLESSNYTSLVTSFSLVFSSLRVVTLVRTQKARVERRESVQSLRSVASGGSVMLKKPAEMVTDKNGMQYAILPSPHLQQVMIFKNGEMVPLDLLAG